MRVAIVGSRSFTNQILLNDVLDFTPNITSIVSGGADGADTFARYYANAKGIPLTEYLPDWNTYGKRAGYLRNEQIIKDCDYVIAFWDGFSKGTLHDIKLASRMKKPCKVIKF